MWPPIWPDFRRFWPLLMLGLVAHVPAYAANDWVSTATYKPGSPLLNNRLCYTDGTDISCDGAAGLLITSGTLQITNISTTRISASDTISAPHFIGDGSGLTGVIAATGDRLVSGTTSMVAVSNTGYISVTQSGTNTAWFDPARGLITIGISSTGPISATNGFFNGNVSVTNYLSANGLLAPSAAIGNLMAGGISATNISATGNISAAKFIGDGSLLTNINAGAITGLSTDRIISTSANIVAGNGGTISFTTGGVSGTAYIDTAGRFVAAGVSTTGPISATNGYFSESVSIGTNPLTELTVASTQKAPVRGMTSLNVTDEGWGGQFFGASARGTLAAPTYPHYGDSLGTFSFGGKNGSNLYRAAFLTVNASSDHNGGNYESDAMLALTPNGSIYPVEVMSWKSNGNVGIGTSNPSTKLEVNGTIKASTISTTNISATGNISANKFIGDGSLLTGVIASTGDRLVSGTTSMVAVSNTGFISVTQSGTNTAWFDPTRGLVTIGISSTGAISATNGFFNGNVSVTGNLSANGLLVPTAAVGNMMVGGISATSVSTTGNVSAAKFIGDGSLLTNINANSVVGLNLDQIVSNTTKVTANLSNYISITTGGVTTAYFDPAGHLIAPGISTTGPISGSSLYISGNAMVSGTIYVSDLVVAGISTTAGTDPGITINNLSWNSLIDIPTGVENISNTSLTSAILSQLQNIASSVIGSSQWNYLAHMDQSVSTTSNVTFATVSATSGVSSTNISATGNISAAKFIGDGSLLTNINAGAITGLSTDRIISTSANIVAGNGGTISFTTGGVSGTAYIDTAGRFVAAGVSTTGPISATNGYFSGNVSVTGNISAAKFIGDGSLLTNIPGSAIVGLSADKITSGTISVTVNNASGYVSLTAGGNTWGYLGSSATYLPNLNTANIIASNNLSATTISTTAMQIISQTNPTTCTSGNAGTLRYNSPTTTLELCTGSGWQPMGVGVPAGTISAFASTTCPTGWSEYTAARGRFLRGIDNGAGLDPDGTRAPGATQADMLKSHDHAFQRTAWFNNELIGGGGTLTPTGTADNALIYMNTASTGGAETRPKNVAVTFCVFNGTSNGWNNPLAGGVNNPGGNTTNVQYNQAGAFTGSDNFTWNNGAGLLTVTGRISTTTISTTNISATGNISAAKFIGDGSLLTNIPGSAIVGLSADKITSGTISVTVNNNTGYISLTAGGNTWGYLGSSATYLPNLRTNTISTTAGLQVGNVAATCASGISGTIRYNTTSNTMEYCNGTAWANLGPSATTPVSFMVNKGGTNQTVATNVMTKLTWSNEVFDTNNNFAGDKFTPTVPGKYIFTGNVYCGGVTGACYIGIYKNGVETVQSGSGSTNTVAAVTTVLDMNGSSDYVELYVYSANATIDGTIYNTNFSGAQLAPQGGAGGSASAYGSSGEIQFNSSGTFSSSPNFTYSSGLLTVSGTISTTAINAQYASFTTLTVGGVNLSNLNFDRIISTSANIVAGNGGTISLTTGGVSGTTYFDTAGRLIGPGISTTGPISVTSLYIAGISATAGVDPVIATVSPSWYALLNIPTAVQNISTGILVSTTTANAQYASFTSVNVNGPATVAGSLQLGGNGSENCTGPANAGTLRINPTTGRLQLCR